VSAVILIITLICTSLPAESTTPSQIFVKELSSCKDQMPYGPLAPQIYEMVTGNDAINILNHQVTLENNLLSNDNRLGVLEASLVSVAADGIAAHQSPGTFSLKKELFSFLKGINKVASPLYAWKESKNMPLGVTHTALFTLTPLAQALMTRWIIAQQKKHADALKKYQELLKQNPQRAAYWKRYHHTLKASILVRFIIQAKVSFTNKDSRDSYNFLTKDEKKAYVESLLESALNTAEIIFRWIFYKKFITAAVSETTALA
jgi:hypothetical protein